MPKKEVIRIRCSAETKKAFRVFAAQEGCETLEDALRLLLVKAGYLREGIVF